MRALFFLLLSAFVAFSRAQQPIECVNSGTGNTVFCTFVSNPHWNSPYSSGSLETDGQCVGKTSEGAPTVVPCLCPQDTCEGETGENPYSMPNPPGYHLAIYPFCLAPGGVGWWYQNIVTISGTQFVEWCVEPVRGQSQVCGHGDVQDGVTGYLPFVPRDDSSFCACDCGYQTDNHGNQCAATGGQTSSCQNPATDAFVNFAVVTAPPLEGVQQTCQDNNGNTVQCFCPADTCATYFNGEFTYPTCKVVLNGQGATGFGWNTVIANNHAFMFCTNTYRELVCNRNGDVPTGTVTTDPYADATNPPGPCTCDCGWFDLTTNGRIGRCINSNFVNPTCVNPTTNHSVTFVQTISPINNQSLCPNANVEDDVPCWCPADTCIPKTTPYGVISLCKPAYTGTGYNVTLANNNAFISCTLNYRQFVCSGHGQLPSDLVGYSPLAPYTNPPGPCTCDTQYWDTTYSDGRVQRCNFQSNCSVSHRFGFPSNIPCGGHGTCLRNSSCACQSGWGGPACDQSLSCPSSSPNLECSGLGTCVQYPTPFNFMTYGVWGNAEDTGAFGPQNYSATGQIAPANSVAGRGTAFLFLLNFNAIPQPAQINALPFAAIRNQCYAGQVTGGPIGCYRSMLEYLFNGTLGTQWQAYLTTNGYQSNMQLFVQNAFTSYYPSLGVIDTRWIAPIATALSSTNHATQAGALALMLSYTMFTDFTDPTDNYPAPYPSFPQYACQCNGGVSPAASSPAGKDCASQCPFNAIYGGTVCSGVAQGIQAGTCQTQLGQCDCSPGYVTATSIVSDNPVNGCNLNLQNYCIPPGGNGAVCSTPGFQSQIQGSCQIQANNVSSPVGSCVCASGWNGKYCANSVCTNTTTECSFHGTCNGVTKKCQCTPLSTSNTQSLSSPPVLYAGTNCSHNAITACGHFVQLAGAPAGTGTWTVCNNLGTCMQNNTHPGKPYACFCQGKNFGAQCQSTGCSPACNTSNSICNLQTGTCSCQTMWGGPMCNVNLCVNGHPNPTGTACVCNPFWVPATIGLAACTVAQCPFVANTYSTGIRACNYSNKVDQNCAGSPANTVGCCYNNCPSCSVSNGIPTCACNPSNFYNQIAGICYPICHGGSGQVFAGTFSCNCANVLLLINPAVQYIDAFCNIFVCANGGRAHSGGCTCAQGWTGTTCTVANCLNGGTVGPNGVCVCVNNYAGNVCQTYVNPNPPDPSPPSSSSTGSTHSSSSSSTGHVSSSSSTGSIPSSSSSSTGLSSSSSAVHSSSSSTASSSSSTSVLSESAIIAISAVAAAVFVTGVVLLGIFLSKLVTGVGPSWVTVPASSSAAAPKTTI